VLALEREPEIVGVARFLRVALHRLPKQALRFDEITARTDDHPERIPLRRLRRIARDGVPKGARGLLEIAAVAMKLAEAAVDPRVAEMRRAVQACDAVLFCTPEYAGALPAALMALAADGLLGVAERRFAWRVK